MKYFNFFSLLLLLVAPSACGAVRPVIQPTDSTHVEVRYETRTVHDTAYVEMPVIVERVATLDTASALENTYAKSEAIVAAGILNHSLETKPVKLPVKVERVTVYKDSLVYRDRVVTETIEKEKKLTAWQSFRMLVGSITLLLAAIWVGIKLVCFVKSAKK
jgi:hypothetical protein